VIFIFFTKAFFVLSFGIAIIFSALPSAQIGRQASGFVIKKTPQNRKPEVVIY